MALATRCPQCGTAFRLVADQLRLHDGLVRCGACSAIFDGRQNQFDVDPATLPGSNEPAPDAPESAVASPVPSVPSPVSPLTPTLVDAPPPTPIAPVIPDRLPELAPVPRPDEPAVMPPIDFPSVGLHEAGGHGPGAREPSLHEPIPLAPTGDANLLQSPLSFGARAALSEGGADHRREPRFIAPTVPAASPAAPRPVEPRDPPSVRASIIDDGLPTPRLRTRGDGSIPDLRARLRADAEAEAAEDVALPELRRESLDPTESVPVEPVSAPAAEPLYAWDPATEDTEPSAPIVVDAPPGRSLLAEPAAPPAPRRVWPWVLGVLLAALVLGGQAVWVWRDDIATNLPITRPVLTALCAPLGCTVGYPRHPELLSIESSALEPWQGDINVSEGGTPSNRLALRVVLRNRHALPQPWPSIELTLTDLSDAAVVRRVLAPSDYLPADTVAKPMPARSERSLRVPVDPPAEAVSGYRLSVFFP